MNRPAPLERFLEIDRPFKDANALTRARASADELLRLVALCDSVDDNAGHQPESCALRVLLRDSGIVAVEDPTLADSTVTAALAERRGSCAALVGLVLALTDAIEPPFDAVVLRNHVVLSRRGSPGEFFDTLDGGRRLTTADLSRYGKSPTDLLVVEPAEYPAYYLDNLAARLEAEKGPADQVESMFVQALEIAPAAARIRYNYGTFLLQQSRYDEAEAMLSRAIALGWKDATAFVNRGAARWQLGRTKAARRDLERALKLDPTNREARVNLERLARE